MSTWLGRAGLGWAGLGWVGEGAGRILHPGLDPERPMLLGLPLRPSTLAAFFPALTCLVPIWQV